MSLNRLNKNGNPFMKVGLIDDDIFNFNDFSPKGSGFSKVNLIDHGAKYVLELEIPEFSKDEIEVSIDNDMIRISDNRRENIEATKEGFAQEEISHEYFEHLQPLPVHVDCDAKITAKYTNGILKILLDKVKTFQKKVVLSD